MLRKSLVYKPTIISVNPLKH